MVNVVITGAHPQLKRGPELPSPCQTKIFGPFETLDEAFAWMQTGRSQDTVMNTRAEFEVTLGAVPLLMIAVHNVEVP